MSIRSLPVFPSSESGTGEMASPRAARARRPAPPSSSSSPEPLAGPVGPVAPLGPVGPLDTLAVPLPSAAGPPVEDVPQAQRDMADTASSQRRSERNVNSDGDAFRMAGVPLSLPGSGPPYWRGGAGAQLDRAHSNVACK